MANTRSKPVSDISDGAEPRGSSTTAPRQTSTPDPAAARDKDASDASMTDTAKKAAADHADAAKDMAANAAQEHAERVKAAGSEFDAGSMAHEASDRIAENLDTAASAIRNADLGELTKDVSDFARRQPLLFFGGAALLGFAAARMIKASDRSRSDMTDRS